MLNEIHIFEQKANQKKSEIEKLKKQILNEKKNKKNNS